MVRVHQGSPIIYDFIGGYSIMISFTHLFKFSILFSVDGWVLKNCGGFLPFCDSFILFHNSIDSFILKPDSDRNSAVIDALTLVNHYLDIAKKGGKKGAEAQTKAFEVFEALAQTGTSIGQLLRQYGQLKSSTPRGLLYII